MEKFRLIIDGDHNSIRRSNAHKVQHFTVDASVSQSVCHKHISNETRSWVFDNKSGTDGLQVLLSWVSSVQNDFEMIVGRLTQTFEALFTFF